MAYQVFVSYSSEDADFIQALKDKLKEAEFDVWIDKDLLLPSQNWRDEIDNAIKASFALIVVLTPEAHESKYVTYEWAYALGLGKPIVPILLEATERHPRLEVIQYLDFSAHFSIDWNKLAQTLQKILLQQKDSVGSIPPFVLECLKAFESYDETNRRKAIEGLKLSSHSAALEALVQGTEHHLQDIRVLASIALAEKTSAQDRRAIPGLIEKIKSTSLASSDYDLSRAVRWLASYSEPETIDIMLDVFKSSNGVLSEYAYHFMINIGEPAVPALTSIKYTQPGGELNQSFVPALRTLGKIGGSNAIAYLVRCATTENEPATFAVEALVELDALDKLVPVSNTKIVRILTGLLARYQASVSQRFGWQPSEHLDTLQMNIDAIVKTLEAIGTPEALIAVEEWRNKQQN